MKPKRITLFDPNAWLYEFEIRMQHSDRVVNWSDWLMMAKTHQEWPDSEDLWLCNAALERVNLN